MSRNLRVIHSVVISHTSVLSDYSVGGTPDRPTFSIRPITLGAVGAAHGGVQMMHQNYMYPSNIQGY